MDREVALGALAFSAYRTSRTNQLTLADWGDPVLTRELSDGFAASVYRNATTGEIVIAFRGTDGGFNADWVSNLAATSGAWSSQVVDAILLVADVQAEYGANVTLTGHSLGGGLASLMAVFFDLQAVVFDPAPFGLSASAVLGAYASDYASVLLPRSMYAQRAGNVTGRFSRTSEGDDSEAGAWLPLAA